MNESQGRVLVVDDERSIRTALRNTLQRMEFTVEEAANGEAALDMLRRAEELPYDVVLLDINMPGMGGIEACRQMRSRLKHVAILMVTVRDVEDDKVQALDAGADDYVTKPFNIRELAARIRAGVRRSRAGEAEQLSVIHVGALELDRSRRTLKKDGVALHLTPKEFDLLQYLMSHAGLPITHIRLLRAVWGPEYGGELEYLRTFIHQLRKKIEDDPSTPRYLLTDSHLGYRFAERTSEPATEPVSVNPS
jgi:two-component system KDP operon response regulator KdpE